MSVELKALIIKPIRDQRNWFDNIKFQRRVQKIPPTNVAISVFAMLSTTD